MVRTTISATEVDGLARLIHLRFVERLASVA
jgi:hypothetical protein